MGSKLRVTLILICTITLILLSFTLFQNNINKVTNASSFSIIKPNKEKGNLEQEINRGLNEEKTSNNDSVVSMFLEMLSKEDANISYLFSEIAQVKHPRTKLDNDNFFQQINEYITGNGDVKIINCIIKEINRSDTFDTYKLDFTLINDKKEETHKILNLKLNSLGQIIELE